MRTQLENRMAGYPKELIVKSKTMPNGVVRLSGSLSKRLDGREGDAQLTFRETPEPRLGIIYDSFDIQSFIIDEKSGKVKVRVKMSLREKYERLLISARLVDQSSEQVLEELPLKTARNVYELNYNEETVLSSDKRNRAVTLIVYGAWGTKEEDDSEIVIVEEYAAGSLSVRYEHARPMLQKGRYITFPQKRMLSGANQDESFNTADGMFDDIAVALCCRPDDTAETDYLCLFEHKPGTNLPLLGIPKKGILNAVSGNRSAYIKNNMPTALCYITPIGGKSGGCMLVSTLDSYASGAGAIRLFPGMRGLKYDMTGPWGVSSNAIEAWQTKYFNYEFVLRYTLRPGIKTPQRYTFYIDSGKQGHQKEAEPMVLRYGCFKKGTDIAMADGSQQRVEDVCAGDYVWSEGGRPLVVKNVVKGKEVILNVDLEDGTLLGVTEEHPLKTADGWVKAKDIKEGMSLIKVLEGRSYKVRSVKKGRAEMVYNLETEEESGAVLSANGVAAGDFGVQSNM